MWLSKGMKKQKNKNITDYLYLCKLTAQEVSTFAPSNTKNGLYEC